MQNYLKQLQAFWDEHVRPLFAYDPEKYALHPYRDWAILITGTGVFTLVLVIGALYMFVQVNDGPRQAANESDFTLQQAIDRGEIEETIELYAQKEARLQELLSSPPFVAAPR